MGAAPIVNMDERDGATADDHNNGADRNGSASPASTVVSNGLVAHARSKSAPAINQPKNGGSGHSDEVSDDDDEDDDDDCVEERTRGDISFSKAEVAASASSSSSSRRNSVRHRRMSKEERRMRRATEEARRAAQDEPEADEDNEDGHLYELPEGEDYMSIYETLDRVKKDAKDKNAVGACAVGADGKLQEETKAKSHSMEALETPTPSLKSFEFPEVEPQQIEATPERRRHRSKPQESKKHQQDHRRRSVQEPQSRLPQIPPGGTGHYVNVSNNANVQQQQQQLQHQNGSANNSSMAAFLKRALRIEGPQLQQRIVSIKKNVRESLGMRIGGGIGSNEGDTPIYIANIHPHGCIGKSKQMKVK